VKLEIGSQGGERRTQSRDSGRSKERPAPAYEKRAGASRRDFCSVLPGATRKAHDATIQDTGGAAMMVDDILRQKGAAVATISPEASIKSAADWLRAKNIGALLVTSGDAILGLVSEREIVHAFSRYGEPVASMPVRNVMARGIITVAPDDNLNHVMRLMTRHRVRHTPVLRNGKLAGIVSIGDVVKRRLDDMELEANILRDAYIAKP
jgi:predicted transcriptional regulator